MTENKRFIPIFDGTDKRVVGAKDNGKIISFMSMFDLLNAQQETIQDQKRQLDELDGLLNKFEVTFEELEDILYMNRSRL